MSEILTPKDNYLMMLRGDIPEYVPSYFEMYTHVFDEELFHSGKSAGWSCGYEPWCYLCRQPG